MIGYICSAVTEFVVTLSGNEFARELSVVLTRRVKPEIMTGEAKCLKTLLPLSRHHLL